MRSDLIVLVLFGLAAFVSCDSTDAEEELQNSLKEHSRLPRQIPTDISDRIESLFRQFAGKSMQSEGEKVNNNEMKKANQVDAEEDLDDLAEMQFLRRIGSWFRNQRRRLRQCVNAIRNDGKKMAPSLQSEMKKIDQVDTEEDQDDLAEMQFLGRLAPALGNLFRRCRNAIKNTGNAPCEMKKVNHVDTEEDQDELAKADYTSVPQYRSVIKNIMNRLRTQG